MPFRDELTAAQQPIDSLEERAAELASDDVAGELEIERLKSERERSRREKELREQVEQLGGSAPSE